MVGTCIIDEAVQWRFQFFLCLLYQCPDTVFSGHITPLEGHPVLSKLSSQLPQCLLSELLINIRDANLRSCPGRKLTNNTLRLMTTNLAGEVSLQKLCPARQQSQWWRRAWSLVLTFPIWNVVICNMQSSLSVLVCWEITTTLYTLTTYLLSHYRLLTRCLISISHHPPASVSLSMFHAEQRPDIF